MYLFYGADNYLVNKAVTDFVSKQDDNYHLVNYYLDKETQEQNFSEIQQAFQSINMFNEKKIIVVSDYFNFFNTQRENWERFYHLVKNLQNNNEVIIKIFSSKIPHFLKQQAFNLYYVPCYNHYQLKTWFQNQIQSYKIKFKNQNMLAFDQLPPQLNIVNNELKKWQYFIDEVPIEAINNSFEKYYDVGVIKLFERILLKNYQQFWIQYCNYWKNTNIDKLHLILMFADYLELIRNVKLAVANAWSTKKIMKFFNLDNNLKITTILNYYLSISKINRLLLKIHDIDYNLKNGKYNKLVVIDAFFLNICDIIL